MKTVTLDMRTGCADQAKKWANYMRAEGLNSCMFQVPVPANDAGFACVGLTDEVLKAEGYAVVSHSAVVTGVNDQGQLLLTLFLLVRGTGESQHILHA